MKDKPKPQDNTNRKPSIKFVKRANMFCRTTWTNGKQLVEWFPQKP